MKKKQTKKAKPTKATKKPAKKLSRTPAKKKAAPTVIKALDTTGGVKKVRGEMAKYQKLLLNLRDHVIDQISGLAGENLRHNPRETAGDLSGYSFHMADTGTDNFDREFALSLVSSEQEALYEIEGALKRIETGTYGQCESCEKTIARERLMAVPFARMCVRCQSEAERNHKRVAVQTATFAEMTEEAGEEEEEE
jgi:RNA polymerase-binding transcription factor DksA